MVVVVPASEGTPSTLATLGREGNPAPPLEPSQVLPLFIDAVRDYALLMLDPAGNVTSWNRGHS